MLLKLINISLVLFVLFSISTEGINDNSISQKVTIDTSSEVTIYKQMKTFVTKLQSEHSTKGVIFGCFIYLLLLCIPFIPGTELGLCIMGVFGAEGAIAVYFTTIVALSISFFIGTKFPQLIKKSKDKNKNLEFSLKWKKLNEKINRGPIQQFISISLLLNFPGNAILGGGGGVAMLFGANKKLSYNIFLVTILISTLPVPLFILSF